WLRKRPSISATKFSGRPKSWRVWSCACAWAFTPGQWWCGRLATTCIWTIAEGSALGAEGFQIAEAVAHPASLMTAYYGVGYLALYKGDLHTALPWLEHAVRICRQADFPAYFPRMAAALGAAYNLGGRIADA